MTKQIKKRKPVLDFSGLADLLASGDVEMLVLDPKKPKESVKKLDAVLKKRLEAR